MTGLSQEERFRLVIEYWDSEGNRLINFNLPEERRKFEAWFSKTYHPKQLSLFDDY